MKSLLLLTATFGITACTTSGDPAAGGFVSGVSGVASGSYQQRIEAKEASVAEGQARTAELQAELAAASQQWSDWKLKMVQTRSRLANAGVVIPASTQAKVNASLASTPSGNTDEARLAALQAAIANARALAAELEGLSA